MASVAHVCVALLTASVVSFGSAFSLMKVAHPTTHPVFDIVFAVYYSTVLVICAVLAIVCVPAGVSQETTTLFLLVTGAALVGVWSSVGVHIVGALYDKMVLKIKPKVIRRGWPWAAINSCMTHASIGLVLAGVSVVGIVHTQSGGGSACEVCHKCAPCVCKQVEVEDDSSSEDSSEDSSDDSSEAEAASDDSSGSSDMMDFVQDVVEDTEEAVEADDAEDDKKGDMEQCEKDFPDHFEMKKKALHAVIQKQIDSAGVNGHKIKEGMEAKMAELKATGKTGKFCMLDTDLLTVKE